jgi:hypothetical protein
LAKLQGAMNAILASDGHGGSPGEGIEEQMDAVTRELADRADDAAVAAILKD